MKKLLSRGLVMVAGIASLPLVAPPFAMERRAADYREDHRFDRLKSFFEKADCPARDYVEEFLSIADLYALDWRLLPSISFVESTGGKTARNNNLFGWDSGRAQFSSPGAGIDEVGFRLSHSSLYRDKDLDGLLATYNPDAEYGRKVKFVMQQISRIQ